jgi:hypothetical protein
VLSAPKSPISPIILEYACSINMVFTLLLCLLGSAQAFSVRKPNALLTMPALSASPSDISTSKRCDWSWADDVYLITTTASVDRLDQTKEELSRVGLLDRVQIRTFKPDDTDR